jgi:hypothetical protein
MKNKLLHGGARFHRAITISLDKSSTRSLSSDEKQLLQGGSCFYQMCHMMEA